MDDTLANATNSSIHGVTSPNLALQTAMNSIRLTLGLPINSYVVWLILRGAGGTIASEFFYLNLIVSVIISALASVLYFAWSFTYDAIFRKAFYGTFIAFFWFPVPAFQCCVCVERYVAVVHPVVFLRYKALRYRVACCCAVWLTVLAIVLIYLFLNPVCAYVFLGFWVGCIAVVCFCCLAVLRALKQPGPGEGQRDSGEGNDLKARAFRIILISLVIMSVTTISYIPFVMYSLLRYSNPVADKITTVISILSFFVHPLLYLYKAGKLSCFKMSSNNNNR